MKSTMVSRDGIKWLLLGAIIAVAVSRDGAIVAHDPSDSSTASLLSRVKDLESQVAELQKTVPTRAEVYHDMGSLVYPKFEHEKDIDEAKTDAGSGYWNLAQKAKYEVGLRSDHKSGGPTGFAYLNILLMPQKLREKCKKYPDPVEIQ